MRVNKKVAWRQKRKAIFVGYDEEIKESSPITLALYMLNPLIHNLCQMIK